MALLQGEYTERLAAQKTLLLVSVLAAAAILILLVTSFGNVRLAILSFVTLASALVGGVIAAYIMLIEHCQHLERNEGVAFGPELVRKAQP